MSLFEFLVTLYAIVTGLGLALLIRSLGQMLESRRKTHLYWVHTCWLAIMLMAYVIVWFQLWSYRDVVTWRIGEVMLMLAVPMVLYLVSHLAVPELEDAVSHDMRAYYYEHHRLLQGLLALAVVLSTLGAGLILDHWAAESWLGFRLAVLAILLPGIWSRRPRVHELQIVILIVVLSLTALQLRAPISE